MTPTAEVAKELRQALKTELGLGPREVSVRTDNYSLGSSIDVTIKVPGILKDKVEEIAKRFARIQYDHATGEILCGGNRHVHVEYAHRLSLDLQAKYGALLPQEDGGEATIAPGATVRREREYFRFFLNGDDARYCSGEGLASIYWAELEIEAAAAAEAAAQLTGIDAALYALQGLSSESDLADVAHGHIGEALRRLDLGDLFGAAQFAGRADWATFDERGPVRDAVELAIESLRARVEEAQGIARFELGAREVAAA
jgi:hypothetical protein